MLLEPGNGDVAASDLQLRLDLAQLLAELALLVGPDRAVGSASTKISGAELAAVASLLQPVALHRSTRSAVRRRKDVLPAVRASVSLVESIVRFAALEPVIVVLLFEDLGELPKRLLLASPLIEMLGPLELSVSLPLF